MAALARRVRTFPDHLEGLYCLERVQLSNCRVYEYQVGILIMVNVYYA